MLEIRSFLGHAGFYCRFIKDFSHIARPLTNLLAKDIPFEFNDACLKSFNIIKKALISTLIIQPLIGLCLLKSCVMIVIMLWGQCQDKKDKKHHVIAFASKTLIGPQLNNATTEKDLLAIVFAIDKFRSYLELR
jgi:hypothetical protein